MARSILFPAVLVLSSAAVLAQGPTRRESPPAPLFALVTRSSANVPGNSWSGGADVSASGRFVAFHSFSDNLVAGDTNANYDVFVHDRATGSTERVSVTSTGLEASGGTSATPSISADGRIVAFESFATDLVPGDTNGYWDVFVHDRVSGETRCVSRSFAGEQGNWHSHAPEISADGRFVAFESFASNLLPDPNGMVRDIFVHDLATHATTMVSVGSQGQAAGHNCEAATISGDGRFVAFHSSSPNLVAGDTNNQSDVFVRDTLAGTIERVSLSSTGAQSDGYSANAAISPDGRYVAFQASAGLVPGDDDGFFDVYVRDRATGTTLGITALDPTFVPNMAITRPSISADGRRVAYEAVLVNYPFDENTQIFVHDRTSGATTALSPRFGDPGNGDSMGAAISANGNTVVYESAASNLVPGDTNNSADVFAVAGGL